MIYSLFYSVVCYIISNIEYNMSMYKSQWDFPSARGPVRTLWES